MLTASSSVALLRELPEEILLLILNYVDAETKIEFVFACSKWYSLLMRKYVRKLFLRWSNGTSLSDLCYKVSNAIKNPYQQLDIYMPEEILISTEVINFFESINYAVRYLYVSESQLEKLTASTKVLRARQLIVVFEKDKESTQLSHYLNSLVDCHSLIINCRDKSYVDFPHLQTVTSLSLLNAISWESVQSLFTSYSKTLLRLTLSSSSLTDVSMLGSIPYLELTYCPRLVDISALNDNDHVIVEDCDKIQDYSQSFANSRKIHLGTDLKNYKIFDLSHWRRVESLQLDCDPFTDVIQFQDNRLPITVKSCYLNYGFVSDIDFTITSNHVLNELKLSYDNIITSLEGYGLERVVSIELERLTSLQSLEGLGRGRNRKIIISYCDQITDFSPLNRIPIVKIYHCKGFTNPLQVRCVRDLTIIPYSGISFKSQLNNRNPYKSIHSLTLPHRRTLKELDGVEKIPFLTINHFMVPQIKAFLENGHIFENHRIEINLCDDRDHEAPLFLAFRLLVELHHRFMSHRYDYYHPTRSRLSHRWIWVRKESLV